MFVCLSLCPQKNQPCLLKIMKPCYGRRNEQAAHGQRVVAWTKSAFRAETMRVVWPTAGLLVCLLWGNDTDGAKQPKGGQKTTLQSFPGWGASVSTDDGCTEDSVAPERTDGGTDNREHNTFKKSGRCKKSCWCKADAQLNARQKKDRERKEASFEGR